MTTKNMSYDHPAYQVRLAHNLGLTAAGASALTNKFCAFTSLLIQSVTASIVATGTSTYASMWNGTATVATGVGAQTFAVIRITNTAAAGATPSLSTATYGPFMASLFDGTTTNTQTNSAKPGFSNNVALYGTATTGVAQGSIAPTAGGGFSVSQGDLVYVVQGTDATSVANYTLEYSIVPLANVTY